VRAEQECDPDEEEPHRQMWKWGLEREKLRVQNTKVHPKTIIKLRQVRERRAARVYGRRKIWMVTALRRKGRRRRTLGHR
jgi:hypothetical protein